MNLREYKPSDCAQLAELFYQTVHSVNAKDYTQEQRNAWATGKVDLAQWDASFREHKTIDAVENSTIVGFGDMDSSGYLDRLYVHKDYQRRGSPPQSATHWKLPCWESRLQPTHPLRQSRFSYSGATEWWRSRQL